MYRSNTLFIGLVILIIAIAAGFNSLTYFNVNTIEVTIQDKERINTKEDSYYLVFTDKGTLKLEDDFFRGNFESSDMYGKLKIDSTYIIKTSGIRIGFFSMYPNIINVSK